MVNYMDLIMIFGRQQLNYKIIIEMSRGFFSALSALTIVAGTAAFYLWKKVSNTETDLIDRLIIKQTLITLRKRAFSTLREISFIINHIRTLEGDLEPKKISDIFMRDGGSGQKKLQAIQALVLQDLNITQNQFQNSCNYFLQFDIQIKLLLELFKKDLNMALEGVIQTYHGPLPRFSPEKVLKIEEQIIKRRMQIISRKFIDNASNDECLRLEAQMQIRGYKASQEYLREEGIHHQKEANQKLFMSLLENYYREDSQFKNQFQRLELDMEMFIIELQNKQLAQKHNEQKIEPAQSINVQQQETCSQKREEMLRQVYQEQYKAQSRGKKQYQK